MSRALDLGLMDRIRFGMHTFGHNINSERACILRAFQPGSAVDWKMLLYLLSGDSGRLGVGVHLPGSGRESLVVTRISYLVCWLALVFDVIYHSVSGS